MMKTLHRPCPVCGSSNARVLHHQRFALPVGHPLPRAFDNRPLRYVPVIDRAKNELFFKTTILLEDCLRRTTG